MIYSSLKYIKIGSLITCLLFSLIDCQSQSAFVTNKEKPNIIIFYIDDMGYGQPSCYGGKLMETPYIDRLAENGVRFTDGYVAAPICGPSRVGLMTGRYQARTGHDANGRSADKSLVLDEVTMGELLKKQGYATGIVGKWHLGATERQYLPMSRGFDHYVGHEGNINEKGGLGYIRGNKSVDFQDHPITSDAWAEESIKFIDKNKKDPFFLYLAFNAVHTPIAAKEETLQALSHIRNERERAYAGMIKEADEAIGQVMSYLDKANLEENTIIFCISDNGGAFSAADMNGLRGRKWYLFEGGIRVPYIVQWKGKIEAGQVIEEPVIQLDVLPTALALAGGEPAKGKELDGVNLLPLLTGQSESLNRDALYWRFGSQYAIRKGKWKLVKALQTQESPMLVNLETDPFEKIDLSDKHPELKQELQSNWDQWNAKMLPPRWEDRRWDRVEFPKKKKRKN